MPVKILMPALSPTMTEGKLATWLKSEGDSIEAGDVIAEIETDKATMEVEAVDEGILGKIIVQGGTDNVPVNDLIAVLLEDGETDADIASVLNDNTQTAIVTDKPVAEAIEIAKPVQDTSTAQTTQKPVANTGNRIFASPLAKRLAKDKNINLADVTGTGPKGRIVKADILSFSPVANKTSSSQVTAPVIIGDMPTRIETNSGIRKIIANRLLESKQSIPHYYLNTDCRLDKLMAIRKEINEAAEGAYKISVNDFIIKATAVALKKVPEVNSSWAGDNTIFYERSDISVAVATDNGLITPIVFDADNKSLKDISNKVKELAGKARDGKLMPEEFQGGSCTVSNLGMFGIKSFSAIINPPQSAILAIGAGEKRPIVDEKGDIVAATMMTVTASFDHRTVDGAVGATYLAEFKKLIENPLSLLM